MKILLQFQAFKTYLLKHDFNCPQNVIQKFPPFVLSLPTSADDVKIVKISCPNFDLFKNFNRY